MLSSASKKRTTAKDCGPGEILRRSFTTSTGAHYPASCIRATSEYGVKASKITRAEWEKIHKREQRAENKTKEVSPAACPPGTMRRSAYSRKAYDAERSTGTVHVKRTVVPAACIKERGVSGHHGLVNPKTGKATHVELRDNKLGQFGYHDVKSMPARERQAALVRAVAGLGGNWLSVFRSLNYLAVINKADPTFQKKLIADRDFVEKRFRPASA